MVLVNLPHKNFLRKHLMGTMTSGLLRQTLQWILSELKCFSMAKNVSHSLNYVPTGAIHSFWISHWGNLTSNCSHVSMDSFALSDIYKWPSWWENCALRPYSICLGTGNTLWLAWPFNVFKLNMYTTALTHSHTVYRTPSSMETTVNWKYYETN